MSWRCIDVNVTYKRHDVASTLIKKSFSLLWMIANNAWCWRTYCKILIHDGEAFALFFLFTADPFSEGVWRAGKQIGSDHLFPFYKIWKIYCASIPLSKLKTTVIRPRGFKTFFMPDSSEHDICQANKSQITYNSKFFLAKHNWIWKCLC